MLKRTFSLLSDHGENNLLLLGLKFSTAVERYSVQNFILTDITLGTVIISQETTGTFLKFRKVNWNDLTTQTVE